MNAKRAAKLMQIAHYYGEDKQVCKLMEISIHAPAKGATCA